MLARLELLGRFEMDHMTSGIDSGQIWPRCQELFYRDLQQDPKGFTAELHAVVTNDRGGFATYGASVLVWDFLTDFPTPDALAILDAAIVFKRTFGLSTFHLRGYELKRWEDLHGPGTW